MSPTEFEHMKSTIERLELEIERLRAVGAVAQCDAHGFLRAVYNNEALPLHVRMDAARTAIKYETPTLAALGVQHSDYRSFGDRLKHARLRFSHREPELLTVNEVSTSSRPTTQT